ncbi:MAG: hypothetical protein KC466_20325 [Myxococcales bacterium]|nr:hypothetical protein [Myxococcales bacterium]
MSEPTQDALAPLPALGPFLWWELLEVLAPFLLSILGPLRDDGEHESGGVR